MPYPSKGCRTCRSRRIKCNQERPSCHQCTKSGRVCAGYDSERSGLAFRDENAYAGGIPRRGLHSQPNSIAENLSRQQSADRMERRSSSEERSREIITFSKHSNLRRSRINPEPVSKALHSPIEEQAFTYYAQSFMEFSEGMPESLHSLLAKLCMKPLPLEPTLELVLNANSLLFFGRRFSNSFAIGAANQKYLQALRKTKEEVCDLRKATTDQFVLSVMFLATFEEHGSEPGSGMWFSDGYKHREGALSMIRCRQWMRNDHSRDWRIDKMVRRQLMRTCIHRACFLPEGLEDGAQFGEHGHTLSLDRCVVQVVRLRAWSHIVLRRMKPSTAEEVDILQYNKNIRDLVAECSAVDKSLVDWSSDLPTDWRFLTDKGPSNRTDDAWAAEDYNTVYNGTTHKYSRLGFAMSWNLYRACRLILNSIIVISTQNEARSNHQMHSLEASAQKNVKATSDDICISVSYYFNQANIDSWKELHHHIDPLARASSVKCLVYLIFPLTIVAAAFGIPSAQQAWAKTTLALIARATSNGTVERVAKSNLRTLLEKPNGMFGPSTPMPPAV
ncbi:hypothetical protein MMC10_003197 [Thelotrema lepadinum]|nr:hypothetical protein [Thelotrema lepadinum]